METLIPSGSENGEQATVIDRRLSLLKQAKRRYAGLVDRATTNLAVECQGYEDGPFVDDDQAVQRLVSDEVETVVVSMDDEMQQVARLLMDGLSTKAVAEQLDMSWHRADRIVTAIRERLEAAGFTAADAE